VQRKDFSPRRGLLFELKLFISHERPDARFNFIAFEVNQLLYVLVLRLRMLAKLVDDAFVV
jgi:hypothetical protein